MISKPVKSKGNFMGMLDKVVEGNMLIVTTIESQLAVNDLVGI